MIGLVQKIMFQLIKETGGDEAVVSVRQQAGIPEDQEFHINQVYSDEEWRRIVTATLEVLNFNEDELMVLYSDYFLRI